MLANDTDSGGDGTLASHYYFMVWPTHICYHPGMREFVSLAFGKDHPPTKHLGIQYRSGLLRKYYPQLKGMNMGEWLEENEAYTFVDVNWSALVRGYSKNSNARMFAQALHWYMISTNKDTKEHGCIDWRSLNVLEDCIKIYYDILRVFYWRRGYPSNIAKDLPVEYHCPISFSEFASLPTHKSLQPLPLNDGSRTNLERPLFMKEDAESPLNAGGPSTTPVSHIPEQEPNAPSRCNRRYAMDLKRFKFDNLRPAVIKDKYNLRTKKNVDTPLTSTPKMKLVYEDISPMITPDGSPVLCLLSPDVSPIVKKDYVSWWTRWAGNGKRRKLEDIVDTL